MFYYIEIFYVHADLHHSRGATDLTKSELKLCGCAGCCFIKYATLEEADRAIRALHNQHILPGVRSFALLFFRLCIQLKWFWHSLRTEIILYFPSHIHRERVLSKSDMLMENENALVIILYL